MSGLMRHSAITPLFLLGIFSDIIGAIETVVIKKQLLLGDKPLSNRKKLLYIAEENSETTLQRKLCKVVKSRNS